MVDATSPNDDGTGDASRDKGCEYDEALALPIWVGALDGELEGGAVEGDVAGDEDCRGAREVREEVVSVCDERTLRSRRGCGSAWRGRSGWWRKKEKGSEV